MQVQANPTELRYTASLFSAGAIEIRQKAKQLEDILNGLVQGKKGWSGEAAKAFSMKIEKLHNEFQQKAGVLDEAVQILNQFAQQMDNVNQLRNQANSLQHTLWSIAGDSESAFHERQSISFQINQLIQEADWQADAADAQATSAFNSLSMPTPSVNSENSGHSFLDEMGQALKNAFDFIGGAVYAVADDLSMGLLDKVLDDQAYQRSEAYQTGKVVGDEISVGIGVVTAISGLVEAVGGAAAGVVFSETGVGAVAGGAVAVEGLSQAVAGGLEAIHAYSKLEDDKMMLSKTLDEESQVNQNSNVSEPTEVEYGDHFTTDGRKKVLKPNIRYTTPEGYTYTTDAKGRIASAEGKLELGTAKRNQYAQRTVGGEDRLTSDEGGHLIASIFKGSGEIDNLVPMDANLNHSEYKSLENTWKKALSENRQVSVKISPIYEYDTQRPSEFMVEFKIDGKDYNERLTNYVGGKTNGN